MKLQNLKFQSLELWKLKFHLWNSQSTAPSHCSNTKDILFQTCFPFGKIYVLKRVFPVYQYQSSNFVINGCIKFYFVLWWIFTICIRCNWYRKRNCFYSELLYESLRRDKSNISMHLWTLVNKRWKFLLCMVNLCVKFQCWGTNIVEMRAKTVWCVKNRRFASIFLPPLFLT